MRPPPRSQSGRTPTAARRLAGYQAALAAFDAQAPYMVTAGATMAAGARAFEAFPKGKRRPTAVLAMSDMAAIGVLGAANAAGLRVPADLSVVGYDDPPMAAWASPPLTTGRQPIIQKARLAAPLFIQPFPRKVTPPP